jgi:hypothetical protein
MGGFNESQNVVFVSDPQDGTITVRRRAAQVDDPIVKAKPGMDEEGECEFKVDGGNRSLSLWQFSRLALEGFFFPPAS